MRRRLCFAAVVLAHIAFTPLLVAQFTEPTKEELAMKADPKAPDATAVFLYREDDTDQLARTRIIYERLKVLTEKGKELATMHIPYEPGSDKIDIQGRTIHADGTVIPLTEGVNVIRNLAYSFTLLEAKHYGSLHDFYQKVAEADQQQLVLAPTPVAKTN